LYHGCGAPFLAWNLCVEHVHNFTTSYWNVSITLHPPIAAEEEGSCDVCMEHGDMHLDMTNEEEQTSSSS